MNARSRVLFMFFLSGAFAAAPVFAADAPDAASNSAPSANHQWQGGHRHHGGEFHRVLSQLNLTAEQKTQIKSIVTQARTDSSTRHTSARANRDTLLATSPNDPGYPALLAAEKANAAARVQTASDLKTQIYAVLTPEQQSRIPTIIAGDRAAREARIAAWRSQHSG